MVPTCSGLKYCICFWKWCPPVLEPNFDLSLGEAELVGHLDAPAPGEVVVRVELLLQLQGLVPATHPPHPESVVINDFYAKTGGLSRC
jgi:hypothetical protein